MATPNLFNIDPFISAGIDPRTGARKNYKRQTSDLKIDIKKFLRIIDEQDAANRYVWHNLGANITSQELERMLYYKGQLCFFYERNTDKFYFMPYALDGTIDFYGRFNTVHPIPMTSGTDDKNNKAQAELLSQLKLDCVYDVSLEPVTDKELYRSCVLLHDYTKQLSQTIIPRAEINDAVVDTMAECVPFMNTALVLGTGINGVRVTDADQQDSVREGSRSLKDAALNQTPWVPLLGTVEMQELTPGAVGKAEEYMLAMQSLDNLRLQSYGIENGGLFEKKAHELESEAAINGGPVALVYEDGLSIRRHFCDVVNSIWGIGIWVEPAGSLQEQQKPMQEQMPQEQVQEGEQENDSTTNL